MYDNFNTILPIYQLFKSHSCFDKIRIKIKIEKRIELKLVKNIVTLCIYLKR
jgi:hypothetical protein